ncbi:unnamed protein product [Vitrella brassicaformis CCMP3155]|uniref:Protein SYS1 homolog n=1 Tax=Vitrella brassicaformis (strain CCMP3155) TaxID=1169540 RepID=A0A0G4EBL2_VITBC|nr:unnamed protein product [Vitrella brassicaformis CCMP3155]|mmetsp:Transcript_52219/g.131236  ORF Transcript_52219/g.131236 Transcript_52219/m.131236 type:complete len:175 (+) Transcript_52219:780-1304(+)|eukprot:CEL93024.1 unnamed protein product [Vitrella brassicaformis CCMP3155]
MSERGRFYGEQEFTPWLTISQILYLQAVFWFSYVILGSAFAFLGGLPLSLFPFFSYVHYSFSYDRGIVLFFALLANSIFVMGYVVAGAVERAKKCLDFVFTCHCIHLVTCWGVGGFPLSFGWWISNILAAVFATIMSECICVRYELQEIKLRHHSDAQSSTSASASAMNGSNMV